MKRNRRDIEYMIYGVILEGKNEKGYTYLLDIFKSMNHFQKNYNWLISDCEIGATKKGHYERLFQSGNHAWITGTELTGILKKENFQWIWGVLSGFQKQYSHEDVLRYPIPCADGNPNLWKENIEIQHPLAEVEIVAWDSSCTLFLTKEIDLYNNFRKSFPKSKDLRIYNSGEEIDESKEYEYWLKSHD